MRFRVAILATVVGACGAAEQSSDVSDPTAPSASVPVAPAQRIAVALNTCPEILSYRVSPLSAPVGTDIELSVSALDVDGDVIAYAWTATEPNLSRLDEPTAKYHCSAEGYRIVGVTLSDARCKRHLSVLLQCTEKP